MGNTTTETPDAIKILEAKINAFNKQWQEYNQNWTNISRISIDKLIKLTFSEEKIEYEKDTTKVKIVERKDDDKLYYYLFNLPNNSGIRIKEENSTCYVTETETQKFSSNKFVYHIDDNFIKVENQKISNDYLTIDWSEGSWVATYIYNQYGVTLTFEANDTIKYEKNTVNDTNEKIIVTRVDNKLYYYLYNLPNNCGICIKEENSICYITEDETQTFSSNKFVYHNDNNFIEKQEISDDYHTIDWSIEEERWIAGNIHKQYGITLNISGETIKYIDEKIIVKRINNKLYYYLYNLPNHFGIRINEQNAVCYSKEGEKQDKRFSVGDLVYYDGNNFIITKDPTTSGYYFTIDPVNRRWVATYKTAFFKEVGSTFDFNFMQRLDSPYTYFAPIAINYRDYVIKDVNKNISNYCRENYGMEAPFHLYTMKNIDNTYEEIYDDQTWYFRSEVINGTLKNNLVILHEKPVSAGSFYQLVR